MKYGMDFQYLPKGAGRPLDDGEVVPIETDEDGFALIPNVGDFVQIDASTIDGNGFSGRVKSRLFSYIRTPGNDYCAVNVVVEETDDDWGMLIKE